MEYPEPCRLFFLFQYPAELLFEIDVEEFTGGLVVGAVRDLLVALEFFDGLVLIGKGYPIGGYDVFLRKAIGVGVDTIQEFVINIRVADLRSTGSPDLRNSRGRQTAKPANSRDHIKTGCPRMWSINKKKRHSKLRVN